MSRNILIKQGEIYDAVHEEPYIADILIMDGKIDKIEPVLEGRLANQADQIIDASGFRVYPGFVDAHCHLGLDGYSLGFEGQDFNELNDAVTPQLSAVDGVNPMDITFRMAREAGVTCVATGPGSSNVLGGTFCVIKTVGDRIDDMIVKEKAAMKCAFGENPKACYKGKEIYSRMTIASKLRETLIKAKEYDRKRYGEAAATEERQQSTSGGAVEYDEKLEALLPVIRGEMPLKAHAHRADDIFTAIRIAKEFGIGLTIDHVTEGHMIAPALAKEGYSLAVGPLLGHATKPELRAKSLETPGVLANAGCRVSIITDSPVVQEQYLLMSAGIAISHGMKETDALRAVTIHAARHIGVEERVGSLETGKDADLVVVLGTPFVSEPEILYTLIDGAIVYQKKGL